MSAIATDEIEHSGGRLRAALFWPLFVLAVLTVAVIAIGLGRYAVPPGHVLGILASNLLPIDPTWTDVERRVVELIRVPRIALAGLAGAGLALSGAALQGIFRNPLVGPDIVGVSAGAAFGGALAIMLAAGSAALLGGAFFFGLAGMTIAYGLARVGGSAPVLMLVLAGVVTGSFFSAMVSLVTYVADPEDALPAIVYWLMGSFSSADYGKLGLFSLALFLGGVPLMLMRFRINVLSLGDEEASAIGVKVERTRWLVLLCVTAITAASVAVAGIVSWVGLVVPHIARMMVGPDHRALLPASALLGAGYVIVVDTVARSASAAEIPLGVLTAIIGAPVFAWLLRRSHGRGWR